MQLGGAHECEELEAEDEHEKSEERAGTSIEVEGGAGRALSRWKINEKMKQ